MRTMLVGVAVIVAIAAMGCAAATERGNGAALGFAEAHDGEGDVIAIEVLDGSDVTEIGATFRVAVDGDDYVVHASLGESPAFYSVTDVTGRLVVAATIDGETVEVAHSAGTTARSDAGGLCDDQLDGIDGVAYRLITAEALESMRDVVLDARAHVAGDDGVAARREGLLSGGYYAIGGVLGVDQCPGASCSSADGRQKCCCGVNRRCESEERTCYCTGAGLPSYY